MPWADISTCAKGREGNMLHKLAGDRTHALRPKVQGTGCLRKKCALMFLQFIGFRDALKIVLVHFSIAQAYLGDISGICQEYLRDISDISPAYLRHISGISQAYLWYISRISQVYLWHISGISQAYFRHSSGISHTYLSDDVSGIS